MESFEDELRLLDAVKKDYAEMVDIIDGPYNPPSISDLNAGIFEKEYFLARSHLEDELKKTFGMPNIWLMGYADGSRCLGVRILEDSNISLRGVVNASRNALAKIHSEMNVDYCVGIGFCDMSRENLPEWVIGVTRGQTCYVELHNK